MNERVTIKDLVVAKLRKLGCDGLASPDAECGCGIDDLAPCGGDCLGCQPARRKGDGWHSVGFTKKETKP